VSHEYGIALVEFYTISEPFYILYILYGFEREVYLIL